MEALSWKSAPAAAAAGRCDPPDPDVKYVIFILNLSLFDCG